MTKRRKKKPLDRVCDVIRTKHYSIRTEKAYVGWIRRFILILVGAGEDARRSPDQAGGGDAQPPLQSLRVRDILHVAEETQARLRTSLAGQARPHLSRYVDDFGRR